MNYVIVDADKGSEVWPNVEGAPITATFTNRSDAEMFVACAGLTADRIRNAAFSIASAFPALNLSEAPINPNGELVLRIVRIIESDFAAATPETPVRGEAFIRKVAALPCARIDGDECCFFEKEVTSYCASCHAKELLVAPVVATGGDEGNKPHGITPEVAAKLIHLRDTLSKMESSELVNEAWHTLYSIADPDIASFFRGSNWKDSLRFVLQRMRNKIIGLRPSLP